MAKLTPEAKARLKQYAAAKKGRKNLKSLDQTLGLVAFDKVQDADGERPETSLFFNGMLVIGQQTHASTWLSCTKTKKESSSNPCPWVRLRHCTDWQVEELAKRWPSRKVAIRVYQGPNAPARWETATLHPVDVVIAWLRFLWPDEKEWGEKAKKYVQGYTERYCHDFPGKGQRVRVTKFSDVTDVDHALGGDTGSVSDCGLNWPWFVMQLDGITGEEGELTLGSQDDRWEILD